jgi:enediyne biosynthesis protein E4
MGSDMVSGVDPNYLLLGQPDGTFKEAADKAGILDYARGRGAALADFNLDGMLDLVEVNYGAGVKVWRNVGSGDATKPDQMGNWLAIQPNQTGPNRDAVGAWIEVKVGDTTMRREETVGGGHAGGQLGPTHFGLGTAGEAQIRVMWPDGVVGPWITATANQFVVIERGATEARPWSPPQG